MKLLPAATMLVLLYSCRKNRPLLKRRHPPLTVYVEKPSEKNPSTTTPAKNTTERSPSTIPEDGSTWVEDGNTHFVGDHQMVWTSLSESKATLYISIKKNGNLHATGGTTAYASSGSLEGDLIEISESFLEFNGMLKTFQYGRNGYPCEDNGKAVFKRSECRNFWRYSFTDCKWSTDYIDIFK